MTDRLTQPDEWTVADWVDSLASGVNTLSAVEEAFRRREWAVRDDATTQPEDSFAEVVEAYREGRITQNQYTRLAAAASAAMNAGSSSTSHDVQAKETM